ncbi:macro domain-containing protein [Synechocystis sp. PCC 6714]|uniref:macro domain-containing protein n=1 Tax=Synechocystis sp. (strain PCC 6714) TaxID=1147 RepID=UPI00040DB972|nr:macro domain-containing protein [Synechocystis sp. PCC 6714]AIE76146.1 Von Willebrand factor type A domain / Macro domain, possibly P-ribose binding module [Synechocystis sp. PCC 6714]
MNTPQVTFIPLKNAVCSERAVTLDLIIRITPLSPPAMDQPRPSLNLGFVIDRSGSMEGHNKITYARQAVCYAIDQLSPGDRLSVTIFDDQVQTLIPSTLAKDKAQLKQLVQGVRPGGCTDLHGGWLQGGIQVSQNLNTELNRIILLSDGLANQGETNPDVIATDAHDLAQRGASTTTLGLGDDYNEDLLEAMARSGDGNYYYVADAEQLPTIFERELQGLASTYGNRVTLAATSQAGVQVLDLLNDFELDNQGRSQLPNLIYGNPIDVVVRLKVPALKEEQPLGTVVLSWINGERQEQTVTASFQLPVLTKAEFEALPLNQEVQQQVALMMSTRAKKEAMERVDRGDYGGAGQVLQSARQEIMGANLPMSAPEAAALEDLEEKLNERQFKSYRKMSSAQNYRRNYNRSAGHSDLLYAFQKVPRLGDITKEKVEAIVNSTDRNLSDSGALSRVIHRGAGPELLQACRDLQGCTVGGAKLTPGFNLRANWVIHTVAPKWKGGNHGEEELLISCYQNCLQLAVSHGIRSLAFPAIACGAMGFPSEIAARIALETVSNFLLSNMAIGSVAFVCADKTTLQYYQEAFQRVVAW